MLGRCARAGRDGTAYSIFSTDDQAHLLDLHLFLSRPFDLSNSDTIGTMPSDLKEEEQNAVLEWFEDNDIAGVYKTSNNAYKHYLQTRPSASADSNKRIKTIEFYKLRTLSDFNTTEENEVKTKKSKDGDVKENFEKILKEDLLIQMKKYRPSGTVFELNPHKQSVPNEIMKHKREAHQKVIEKFNEKLDQNEENMRVVDRSKKKAKKSASVKPIESEPSEEYINSAFSKVFKPKQPKDLDDEYKPAKKKKKIVTKDEENYIPYHSSDRHTEEGLAINTFSRDLQNAELSVTADNQEGIQISKKLQKWDRIRKKMVTVQVRFIEINSNYINSF